MAALDSNKTIKNLLKKGFREATNKSKDHIRVEFWYNNQLTAAKTKLSHNGQDINDSLISLMAKQTYLSNKDFIKLADCTMSEAEYISALQKKSIIPAALQPALNSIKPKSVD